MTLKNVYCYRNFIALPLQELVSEVIPHNKQLPSLRLLLLTFALLAINNSWSQSTVSNNKFFITGEIAGRDTGTVILWYADKNNKGIADTAQLNRGEFHFSGTTNRVCEAYLWADPSNHAFDNPSMIRFLLEPGNISMFCKKDEEANGIIKGSGSETEKEKWDKQKLLLLPGIAQIDKSIDSVFKLSKVNPSHRLQDLLNFLFQQRFAFMDTIKQLDVKYIEEHPNSYLSAYLLFRYTHIPKLSVDSLKAYYTKLPYAIKKSSVGHDVLAYIYPLTDDDRFRKNNPLVDVKFDQRLSKLKSVYDLSFIDTLGNTVGLSSFKGKYLVIDFWASWCKPCIANIPALKQLYSDYNPDFIQFISISLDDKITNWKQSIIKNDFTGIQLLSPDAFYGLAAVYCKVLWVPMYIIVNPDGHIIQYDAPQAIDPELKILLDHLLKQDSN
jgi:thiol-disulfide isomerase/thioredoxin